MPLSLSVFLPLTPNAEVFAQQGRRGWRVAMMYIPPSYPELSLLPHSHFSFFPCHANPCLYFSISLSFMLSPPISLHTCTRLHTCIHPYCLPFYMHSSLMLPLSWPQGFFVASCPAWQHCLCSFFPNRETWLTSFSGHWLSAQAFHLPYLRFFTAWQNRGWMEIFTAQRSISIWNEEGRTSEWTDETDMQKYVRKYERVRLSTERERERNGASWDSAEITYWHERISKIMRKKWGNGGKEWHRRIRFPSLLN